MFEMSSSSSEWGSCEDRLADLCSSRHLQNHQCWTDMRFVQKICQRFLQWFFQRFFTSIGLTLALFKGFNQFTLDVGKTGRSDPCQDLLVELTTFIVGQSPKSWKLHFSSLPAPWLAQFEEKITGIGPIWGELTAAPRCFWSREMCQTAFPSNLKLQSSFTPTPPFPLSLLSYTLEASQMPKYFVIDHEKCVKRHLLQSSSY